jgi:hypothetical protein
VAAARSLPGRRLALVLLLGALAWSAYGFANEWRIARFHARWGGQPADRPSGWRHTTRAAQEMLGFALRAAEVIPAGARVAVESDLPASEQLFLRLWLAYAMPRHDLAEGSGRLAGVEYVVSVGARPDRAGRRILLREPLGAVLRNLPPGEVARPRATPGEETP